VGSRAPRGTSCPVHAGIPYVAASRLHHRRLWNTASPFTGDDHYNIGSAPLVIASESRQSVAPQGRKLDCFVAPLLAMTARYNSAIPRRRRNCFRQLDAGVEASGPHDFAVRNKRPRLQRSLRPPHPAPYVEPDIGPRKSNQADAGSLPRMSDRADSSRSICPSVPTVIRR
jgi:hypothetical protein